MKRIILLLAILVLFSSITEAQKRGKKSKPTAKPAASKRDRIRVRKNSKPKIARTVAVSHSSKPREAQKRPPKGKNVFEFPPDVARQQGMPLGQTKQIAILELYCDLHLITTNIYWATLFTQAVRFEDNKLLVQQSDGTWQSQFENKAQEGLARGLIKEFKPQELYFYPPVKATGRNRSLVSTISVAKYDREWKPENYLQVYNTIRSSIDPAVQITAVSECREIQFDDFGHASLESYASSTF